MQPSEPIRRVPQRFAFEAPQIPQTAAAHIASAVSWLLLMLPVAHLYVVVRDSSARARPLAASLLSIPAPLPTSGTVHSIRRTQRRDCRTMEHVPQWSSSLSALRCVRTNCSTGHGTWTRCGRAGATDGSAIGIIVVDPLRRALWLSALYAPPCKGP